MLFFANPQPEKKKTIVRPRTIQEIKKLQSFVKQYKSEPGKSLNESIKSMAKRDEGFNEFLKNFKATVTAKLRLIESLLSDIG